MPSAMLFNARVTVALEPPNCDQKDHTEMSAMCARPMKAEPEHWQGSNSGSGKTLTSDMITTSPMHPPPLLAVLLVSWVGPGSLRQ